MIGISKRVRSVKLAHKARAFANGLVALTLITGTMVSLVPKSSAAVLTPAPRISFTFDDGMASAYNLAAPALQKYGYTGTDYVISGCVGMTTVPNSCPADEGVAYMTWAQINALHSTYGWEIGSHTVTHPLLATTSDSQPTKLTQAQMVAELTNSKAAIKANTGVDPTAFATPYGDYEPAGNPVLAEIAKLYTSHRGFADTGLNTFPYNDYLLRDQPIQAGVSVATAQSYIDQAIATNSWLVLTFHEIKNGDASSDPEEYQYNVADLEAIAAYAQSRGIANTNVSNGLAGSPGNLLPNAGFDAPISATVTDTTTWSTSAPANVQQNTGGNGNHPNSANSVWLTSINSAANLNVQLFSPQVAVAPKPYVIKAYVNILQIAANGELAFYVDEYDANGTYLSTQYTRAWSIFSTPNPLAKEFSFEYVPAANVAKARLQAVAVNNSGLTAYIDNVLWFAQDGSTGGVITPGGKPGDANGDNAVDALDLSTLLSNWSRTGATKAQGDFNADSLIDALDLSTLLTNWGK